jgi:hypothetical protein
VRTPHPVPALVAAAAGAAAAALLAGCDGEFTGPYPCDPGYASCSSSNLCETHIAADPRACGSCGALCPLGALCDKGACLPAPPTIATDVSPSALGINTSNLYYWSAADTSSLMGLPTAGGAEFTVPTPGLWQPGGVFAVDDTSVYYLVQSFASGPGSSLIDSVPAAAGAAGAPAVVATLPSMSGFPTNLILAGGTLYFEDSTGGGSGNESAVTSVPAGGGALTTLGTFPNAQGLAVDGLNVYVPVFPSGGNGCAIDRAPLAGGAVSALVDTQSLGCPSTLASDGTHVYLVDSNTRYGNDNGSNVCVLSFLSVPVGGGAATTMAEVQVDEQALRIAVDGSNVYAVTNQSAWKVPLGGGSPSRIAGNLQIESSTAGGQGPTTGSGSGCTFNGSPSGTSVAIALDDTSLYIAQTNPAASGTGLLLKIPK